MTKRALQVMGENTTEPPNLNWIPIYTFTKVDSRWTKVLSVEVTLTEENVKTSLWHWNTGKPLKQYPRSTKFKTKNGWI